MYIASYGYKVFKISMPIVDGHMFSRVIIAKTLQTIVITEHIQLSKVVELIWIYEAPKQNNS